MLFNVLWNVLQKMCSGDHIKVNKFRSPTEESANAEIVFLFSAGLCQKSLEILYGSTKKKREILVRSTKDVTQ